MSMTQTSSPLSASRPRRTTRDLTAAQLWLVQIMSEYQFGRIENLRIESGQPVPDQHVTVVRTARFGSTGCGLKVPASDDSELKQIVRALFDEIEQIQDGVIARLEFKHGLPFLLETVSKMRPVPMREARTF